MVRKGEVGPNQPGLRRDLVRFMAIHTTGSCEVNRSLLDQYRLRKRPHLTRRIGFIATLAAVAPLLGLLGTVSGMITTFDVIALFGTGNARAMAGGISESLITTQSGLSVAIPGMFMGVLLTRRSRRLAAKLDETISTIQRSMT
jgi:biopolymer transport protein ExbB